jgi:hypothetical protein
MSWLGHMKRTWQTINAWRSMVGNLEGKRPLGRPRRKWDDIKWILKGMSGRELIHIAQDRDKGRAVEGTVTYVRVQQNAGNLVPTWGSISFSKRTLLMELLIMSRVKKILRPSLRNFLHPRVISSPSLPTFSFSLFLTFKQYSPKLVLINNLMHNSFIL